MLEILLIRHGQTDWNRDRRIMGRKHIPLNRVGRSEATRLERALKGVILDAIYTSPMKRAVETARHVRGRRRVAIQRVPGMAEIDYGLWVGKTFEEVIPEKAFHVYHKTPAKARAPRGEHMKDVQKRTIRFIEKIRKRHRKGRVAVVSHADVIKTVLVHYLGMHLNDLMKFRIDNASVSLLWFHEKRARVMTINSLATPSKLFGLRDLLSPPQKTGKALKK